MLIDKEPRTTITLEALLRGVGPKGVALAIARVCERLASEETSAQWPAWLQAADIMIEMSSLLPDLKNVERTGALHAWTRALVQ